MANSNLTDGQCVILAAAGGVDAPQQVIGGDVIIEPELVEQLC